MKVKKQTFEAVGWTMLFMLAVALVYFTGGIK